MERCARSLTLSRWENPSAVVEEESNGVRTKGSFLGHLRETLMRHRKLLVSYTKLPNSRHHTVLIICSAAYFLLLASVPVGASIDCFKCVSRNGDNPSCEDPFHNNFSAEILESPCMGGRKGRNGLFPATFCIKLSGLYVDNGESIIVRDCALDSGTLTTDTEIVRMSHCGSFVYDDRNVKGCVQTCEDSDGCNHSSRPISNINFPMLSLLTFLYILISKLFMRGYSSCL